MFNTTLTRTTKYGYSNTITLAQAMVNRQYIVCDNLARTWSNVRFAMLVVAASKARKSSPKRARKAK